MVAGRRADVEDALAYFRDAARLPQRPAVRAGQRRLRASRWSGCWSSPTWRLAVFDRLAGSPRPGAGGDRREGRQGADLPPRLRRALGGPARRRHAGRPVAGRGGAGRGVAAGCRSCSARHRWSAAAAPAWRSTRRRCAPRSTPCWTRCSTAATLTAPDGAAGRAVAGRAGRDGVHTEELAPCSPSCSLARAAPRRRPGERRRDCRSSRRSPGGARAAVAGRGAPDPSCPMLTLADLGVAARTSAVDGGTGRRRRSPRPTRAARRWRRCGPT